MCLSMFRHTIPLTKGIIGDIFIRKSSDKINPLIFHRLAFENAVVNEIPSTSFRDMWD